LVEALMSTTWTSADVAMLERAIATGALRVRYADGRETLFRSLKEMLALLDLMKASIASSPPPRVSLAKFTRD
jgi:hypothetical protein